MPIIIYIYKEIKYLDYYILFLFLITLKNILKDKNKFDIILVFIN
jgi:hypothetical protein